MFSHRHIQQAHLLKGGQKIAITTYTNFGFTKNKAYEISVKNLRGNRAFGPKNMNMYQLEYEHKGYFTGLTKKKSFFYRP